MGYVVKDSSGLSYLIGNECGQLHYGGDRFRVARTAYFAFEKKQNLIAQLQRVISASEEVMREAETLLLHPSVAAIEATKSQFNKSCPNAFTRLSSAVLTGGLTAHEPFKNRKGKTEIALVQLGAVEGAVIVRSDVKARVQDVRKAIIELLGDQDELEKLSPTELTVKTRQVGSCLSELLRCRDELAGAPRFFSKRNVRRLERWAKPYARWFRIAAAENGAILIHDNENGTSELKPLVECSIPPLKNCKKALGQ